MEGKNKELKRCPFCGGLAELWHDDHGAGFSYIECAACGLKSPSFVRAYDSASDDRAREYWNTRAVVVGGPDSAEN